VRTVTVDPRDAIDFVAADWADTVVVVERGVLEIECCSGTRAAFPPGSVVVFDGLTLRHLRNAGSTPLVLTALSRRRTGQGLADDR
jgi:hypothetical protein